MHLTLWANRADLFSENIWTETHDDLNEVHWYVTVSKCHRSIPVWCCTTVRNMVRIVCHSLVYMFNPWCPTPKTLRVSHLTTPTFPQSACCSRLNWTAGSPTTLTHLYTVPHLDSKLAYKSSALSLLLLVHSVKAKIRPNTVCRIRCCNCNSFTLVLSSFVTI